MPNIMEKSELNTIRTMFAIGGVLAVISGLLILFWPGRTALVVAAIIAVYAIADGLAYVGIGAFSKRRDGWSRIGHILLGVLFVAAGIIAFTNLGLTALSLATFLGILVGIMWLVEGVVSLSTLGFTQRSRGWTVFFAIVSIIAGISLLFTPLLGAAVLWWLLGIMAVVLGAVQIGRALSMTRTV